MHNFNDNFEICKTEYLLSLNQLNMVQNNTTVISTEDVIQFLNDPNEQVQYIQYSDKEIVDLVRRNGTNDGEDQETEILEDENDSENDGNSTLNSTLVVNGQNNFITQQSALNNIYSLISYANSKIITWKKLCF